MCSIPTLDTLSSRQAELALAAAMLRALYFHASFPLQKDIFTTFLSAYIAIELKNILCFKIILTVSRQTNLDLYI